MELQILKGKTPEQAVKYFEDFVNDFPYTVNPVISEVYAEALLWKKNKLGLDMWGGYKLREVAISLILGEL